MDRRSFLKTITGAIAGVFAPIGVLFAKKPDPRYLKRICDIDMSNVEPSNFDEDRLIEILNEQNEYLRDRSIYIIEWDKSKTFFIRKKNFDEGL